MPPECANAETDKAKVIAANIYFIIYSFEARLAALAVLFNLEGILNRCNLSELLNL